MQTAPQVDEAIPTEPINNFKAIRKLANELLVKHENDWDAAAEEAVEIILADPKPWEPFVNSLITRAVTDIVKSVGAYKRSRVLNGYVKEEFEYEYENHDEAFCRAKANSVPTLERGISGETLIKTDILGQVEATSSVHKNVWMNKAKKVLGKCTKEDLALEIEMFTDKAMECDRRREQFTRIYDALEPGQMVEEKFNDNELKEICESSYKEITDRWAKYRK